MAKKFLKNPIVKNILSALAVAVFGFILLNLAFIFYALFIGLMRGIIGLFVPLDENTTIYWLPPLMHALTTAVILLISWLILKSKLRVLFKAIYMTVPLAVVYATMGMFLYPWPAAAYLLGGLFFLSVLYYLHRTKQPWLYYYTLVLISFLMLMVGVLGVEI
ncbi:MAG: hypothetical protein V1702_03885 [Candidatus Woesearchaeota archaeon]